MTMYSALALCVLRFAVVCIIDELDVRCVKDSKPPVVQLTISERLRAIEFARFNRSEDRSSVAIHRVCVLPDGERALVTTWGSIYVVSLNSLQIEELLYHGDGPTHGAFLCGDTHVIIANSPKCLVLDAQTLELVYEFAIKGGYDGDSIIPTKTPGKFVLGVHPNKILVVDSVAKKRETIHIELSELVCRCSGPQQAEWILFETPSYRKRLDLRTGKISMIEALPQSHCLCRTFVADDGRAVFSCRKSEPHSKFQILEFDSEGFTRNAIAKLPQMSTIDDLACVPKTALLFIHGRADYGVALPPSFKGLNAVSDLVFLDRSTQLEICPRVGDDIRLIDPGFGFSPDGKTLLVGRNGELIKLHVEILDPATCDTDSADVMSDDTDPK